ncbi:MAG: amidohydrolase family protein [Phycisphaerae bacterium]
MISEFKRSFPLFDGHMHYCQTHLDETMASYGECGVIGGINLWGAASAQYNFVYHGDYAEFLKACRDKGLFFRFAQFYWPDWMGFAADPDGFIRRLCDDLPRYAELGATGLKVWKDLGMFARFADGTPAMVDDERLEPVWRTVADLGLWVSAHLADPGRSFASATTGVTKQQIYAARDRWLAGHKDIRFIICHSGNHDTPEEFDRLLSTFPDIRVDLRNTLANGDHETNRRLLEKHADKLYIGPDLGIPENRPADRPWNIEHAYRPWRKILVDARLSPETLEKIAWRNGVRDFFGPTPAFV